MTNSKLKKEKKSKTIRYRHKPQDKILSLEKENHYLKNIIRDLPGSIYWKDKNGIYLGRNLFATQVAQNLKLEPITSTIDSVIGKTDYDYLPKEVADQYRKNDLYVMETGEELVAEEIIPLPNGNLVQLSCKRPLCDDKGEIIGVIGNTIDITDRKKAEKYRFETAQKIINFSTLVAGSIAHELKNPLAGIRMQMQTLQNINLKKIPQQTIESLLKDMAAAIIKTVDATTYVIDGMLKKVRTFATGEVHYKEFEEISIADDVENLLNTYPFENDQQDLISVVYNTRFNYLGDRVLTAHVLSNLMKNALHAIAQTDKSKASITIETKTEGDFNVLIFRDTATGIPKDFQCKIFDQFETKKDVHGGTGLGLAFCKSVMESYSGNITCNSEEGKYTEFVIKFPKITTPKVRK